MRVTGYNLIVTVWMDAEQIELCYQGATHDTSRSYYNLRLMLYTTLHPQHNYVIEQVKCECLAKLPKTDCQATRDSSYVRYCR
jgi:hypothetical protein